MFSFYLRAQMLAPKNGRSYNQLALLAMYQNRRLDAVYYYMRSLAASNPFLTARDNLLTIFDEVRKKVCLNPFTSLSVSFDFFVFLVRIE